ncbi:MAG TPA: signal recognition particle-docking protein FtsY [Dokdonella sp.]|uniref:signal recognition particle-docking protein FtsY n=1 Tax=Dokdonella sp. TaxID=2291710 RepID=UPI002C1D62FA|nr:signal recognition particle-docking protein FtsY [Dokdonella sp.]HUD40401.1 signal recognition particle-docking protein FtsY [Dokdonella sp.]
MLKFWKKKPAADAPPAAADSVAPSDDRPLDAAAPAAPVEPLAGHVEQVEPPSADTDTDTDAMPSAAAAGAHDATAEPARRSWRDRLAGSAFARSLGALFVRNPKLDDALLDDLETALITADVGVAASTDLVERLRRRVDKREFADAAALLAALRAELIALVAPVAQPLEVRTGHKPHVVLVVGVNGVGKTTTIGKLARRYRGEGLGVILAAGDTFRAAAVEQLTTWGERNQVPVIAQGSGADSASVIFDALQTARARGADLLIADTAGRLHTQSGLMDELSKIRRVLAKLDAEAPHEVLLVIDGTTGQNAINQTRQFREAIGVTGLVVTKLDGTAKGGVVFALAREFGLPIRFVGLGEGIEDLRIFDAAAFVDGLLPPVLD